MRSGGSLIGAVRLAFSREKQRFYISYLTVAPEARTGPCLGLLLGAVFHLAREAGAEVVHGDASERNLGMYLAAGCYPTGAPSRKYGFRGEWTPIAYVLGTRRQSEHSIAPRIRLWLASQDCAWQFGVRLICCADRQRYRDQLRQLIPGRSVQGTIPHLGTEFGFESAVVRPVIVERDVIAPHRGRTNGDEEEGEGGYFNDHFSDANVIVSLHGSPLVELARTYSLLTGKRLLLKEKWSSAMLAGLSRLPESVMLVTDPAQFAAARLAVAKIQHECSVGIACARSASALSEALLRSYLAFVGPASDRLTPRLVARQLRDLDGDVFGFAALDRSAPHSIICGSRRAALQAAEELEGLLRAGLPVAEAVRRLERLDRSKSESGGQRYCLIGDPCLRYFSEPCAMGIGEHAADAMTATAAASS